MGQQFLIWTGGGQGDPEDGLRAAALDALPDPEPLPRAAFVTYWWGKARCEFAAYAGSIRTTPWGNGWMTWLDFKGKPLTNGEPDSSAPSLRMLVPVEYITDIRPGPTFVMTARVSSGSVGIFPPSQPDPPHAIPLSEIERRLAELSSAPTDERGFSIRYPVFALRRPDGDYVGFGSDGEQTPQGADFGIAVFTTEAGAAEFLRNFARGSAERKRIRVERFDRFALFRRFLRSYRDTGAFVVFDPAHDGGEFLYVDHGFPAAVVLERYLPQVAWGLNYPIFVLRAAAPGITLHTTEGHRDDGERLTVLPVFTDTDLAERALPLASAGAAVVSVPDSATFERLLRELPDVCVVFDHEPARGPIGKIVMSREQLLANLENMEL